MKIKLIKQIHSNSSTISSNDVWLFKYINIPSIPPLGLVIDFNNGIYEKVIEVVWNIKTGFIIVRVEADITFDKLIFRECRLSDYSKTIEFNSSIQKYLNIGWQIQEKNSNDYR